MMRLPFGDTTGRGWFAAGSFYGKRQI